jgi:protein-S-isoprenylcysteine O-methyltransferase Ste14
MTSPIPSGEPPTRIPWPPILIAATIAGGLLLDKLAPLPLPARLEGAGGALIALALLSDIWCALELWRHHTTVMSHREVSALVTTGPYRFSRNPIYLSHVALTAGVGMLLGSLWILLLTPILILGLMRFSIMPEEEHLARKFGPSFADYAAKTRRLL